jgi:hypothetical protein
MIKKSFRSFITEIDLVNESFDTKFDSLNWTLNDSTFTANAILDDDEFKLYIQVYEYAFADKDGDPDGVAKCWLNVAFSRVLNGRETEELLNVGNQSRQLGAVINALVDKLKELTTEYQIDAIVLMARAGEEKRMSLYQRIANFSKIGLHAWRLLCNVSWAGYTALVLSEHQLNDSEFSALKLDLERRGKILYH